MFRQCARASKSIRGPRRREKKISLPRACYTPRCCCCSTFERKQTNQPRERDTERRERKGRKVARTALPRDSACRSPHNICTVNARVCQAVCSRRLSILAPRLGLFSLSYILGESALNQGEIALSPPNCPSLSLCFLPFSRYSPQREVFSRIRTEIIACASLSLSLSVLLFLWGLYYRYRHESAELFIRIKTFHARTRALFF